MSATRFKQDGHFPPSICPGNGVPQVMQVEVSAIITLDSKEVLHLGVHIRRLGYGQLYLLTNAMTEAFAQAMNSHRERLGRQSN